MNERSGIRASGEGTISASNNKLAISRMACFHRGFRLKLKIIATASANTIKELVRPATVSL
jgi:hypothetical protein